jgi:hypothetical protein
MFISLYEDVDAGFGKVVGIRINSAEYRPIDYLTEEEKEARARKKAEKEKVKTQEQEQAVAEQPATELDDEAE